MAVGAQIKGSSIVRSPHCCCCPKRQAAKALNCAFEAIYLSSNPQCPQDAMFHECHHHAETYISDSSPAWEKAQNEVETDASLLRPYTRWHHVLLRTKFELWQCLETIDRGRSTANGRGTERVEQVWACVLPGTWMSFW